MKAHTNTYTHTSLEMALNENANSETSIHFETIALEINQDLYSMAELRCVYVFLFSFTFIERWSPWLDCIKKLHFKSNLKLTKYFEIWNFTIESKHKPNIYTYKRPFTNTHNKWNNWFRSFGNKIFFNVRNAQIKKPTKPMKFRAITKWKANRKLFIMNASLIQCIRVNWMRALSIARVRSYERQSSEDKTIKVSIKVSIRQWHWNGNTIPPRSPPLSRSPSPWQLTYVPSSIKLFLVERFVISLRHFVDLVIRFRCVAVRKHSNCSWQYLTIKWLIIWYW